jgi:hypothetical protein
VLNKHRIGELPAGDAAVLTAELEADYFGDEDEAGRFAILGLPAALLDDAARLVATQGLRACGAVPSGRRQGSKSCRAPMRHLRLL